MYYSFSILLISIKSLVMNPVSFLILVICGFFSWLAWLMVYSFFKNLFRGRNFNFIGFLCCFRSLDLINVAQICISSFFFFFNLFIYLFQLCWVFVSVRGLSVVVASGGHSSSWCAGLSLSRPLLLWSTGSRRAGSAAVAHGPSCSAACGIFPDQGSNPCPLHWQADSQPLRHQGSPALVLKRKDFFYYTHYTSDTENVEVFPHQPLL